jgi:hypothetical protein
MSFEHLRERLSAGMGFVEPVPAIPGQSHRLEVEAVFRIGRILEILSLNWSSKSHPSKPLPPWL